VTETARVDVAVGALQIEVDGAIVVVSDESSSCELSISGGASLTMRFSGLPGERLVGLGERFVHLEQTGRLVDGNTCDIFLHPGDDSTYSYVPFVISSAGYGAVVESYAPAQWDLYSNQDDSWVCRLRDDRVTLLILKGTPKQIVSAFTARYGRPPMPPPWALGVWKTTLGGTEAVLRHAQSLRESRIPVSACWVYDHYHEATNSGCGFSGTYPSGEYPDLNALTAGINSEGFRALGYVQPAIYGGSSAFDEGARQGFLLKRDDGELARTRYFNPKFATDIHDSERGAHAVYVDFTNPDAADWYGGLLRETVAQGWDGWMQDMGERIPDESRFFDGTDGPTGRNMYPLLYHRHARTVTSDNPDFVEFVRSGALGVTPHVTAAWPGDQTCDWTRSRGLASVIPTGPSIGLVGISTWGPDFSGLLDGNDGGAGGRDEELWIRWCQFGALNPIMRDHLGFKNAAVSPVDLWTSARTIDAFREYADRHLRLFPYLRALASEAHLTGIPIVRALFLEYPEYEEAWSISDQYLLGDALLVAPVIQPGATTRTLWFPPGKWSGLWHGRSFEGPSWRTVDAPLAEIPVFRREDADVPMLDVARADLWNVASR
jgi:alpha-glucosidase (family GH31 glycosyl hydrolase)